MKFWKIWSLCLQAVRHTSKTVPCLNIHTQGHVGINSASIQPAVRTPPWTELDTTIRTNSQWIDKYTSLLHSVRVIGGCYQTSCRRPGWRAKRGERARTDWTIILSCNGSIAVWILELIICFSPIRTTKACVISNQSCLFLVTQHNDWNTNCAQRLL